MRRISLSMVLIALATLALFGCSGNKQEPFKEWWAEQTYEDYVPPTAQIVAEGTGTLQYTPTKPGTLYLLDLDDMRKVKEMMTPNVVATGAPLPGPVITFDPNTASFSREGKKPLKLTKVIPGHRHQLRWQPAKPS